jgi:hypothetical protein
VPKTAFLTLVPDISFLFSHLCCHFVSPPPFLYYYQFFFPFLCCLIFHICSFSALPVLHRHLSSHPFSLQFSTKTTSVSISVLRNCSLFSFLPLLAFPPSFSPHYYVFFCLPALHMVILPWSSTGLTFTPSFYFIFPLPYIVLIFTYLFFVLVLLLPLLLCPCSLLHNWFLVSPSSAHGISTME